MPNTSTRTLTAHVPVDLADRVDVLASRLERPRGWVVKEALAAWVAQEEERHRLTLEALEEMRLDDGVAHDRVRAWAENLGSANPLPPPACD